MDSFITTQNPSLRKHLLSSLLPTQNKLSPIEPTPQFIKSREFYKPEQFIWNNPHRTSKKMYQYYHKFNDDYEKNLKPYHEHLQEQDRIDAQRENIRKLTSLRVDIRDKFNNRIMDRYELEARAGCRRNTINPEMHKCQTERKIQRTKTQSLSKGPSLNMMSLNMMSPNMMSPNMMSRRPSLNMMQKNGQETPMNKMSVSEQTFLQSLKKYDVRLGNLKKIVSEDIQENRDKIRSHFAVQKTKNHPDNPQQ